MASPSFAVAGRRDAVPSGPAPGRAGCVAPAGGSCQQHAHTRVLPGALEPEESEGHHPQGRVASCSRAVPT